MFCRSLFLACSLLLSVHAGAVTPAPANTVLPPGVTAGATVEGISEYRLSNGLTVLLFPDASTPSTLVNVTYAVGAAQENYGESGMAHLLEHLLFKGTPTIDDIAAEFKRRGITYNGTTGQDRTNYYGWFPADEQTLDWMLAAEADRMINANVAKAQLDSEMTVVRNELEIGENQPTGVLVQRMTSQAFLWHAYGKSVIGNRADVENVPIDRLQAFYRTWYQPDNATVIVAGRFDPSRTLARIQGTFGAIARPQRRLPARYTVEPAQDGEREVTIRRVGELHLIGLGYHTPATAHPDAAALRVLTNIMGAVPAGRLQKALIVPKLAANSEAAVDSFLEPGLAGFYATPTLGVDPARVERVLLDQVEGLAKHPITEAEVRAAKQRLANMYERASRSNVLGVANALSESIAAGDWRLGFFYRDAIAKVTAADVNRVAATYLVPANRTLARFIPSKVPQRVQIPAAPAVAGLLADYKGQPAVATGEIFDSSPENVQQRTRTVVVGDGLHVALLPKQSRGNRVSAELMFHFGDEKSLAGRQDAASFAGSLLMRGTPTMTREQISQRFDDLKARVSVVGAGDTAYIGIDTDRDNLLPALRLAAEILRSPVFPAEEFEQLRSQSITGLEERKRGPGYIADFAMRKHFDPWPVGHPRAVRSLEQELASIKAVKLDDVRAFHRDFYGTAQGEIAVVGDFDAEPLQRELGTLFAGWKSPVAFARKHDPYYQPPTVIREAFETPDKANAVIVSRTNFPITVDDPDHPALLVAGRIFGGGAKASRLGDRVREKEGLSYYVGSGVIVNPEDDTGVFYMQATAAPENMGKVETAMTEELQRLVRDGITAQELADAKAALLSSYKEARFTDGGIASSLRSNLYMGRTMQWDADFERAIGSLTVEQVNAAIRRRINPTQVSTFIAGDFARVSKPGPVDPAASVR